jgi:hypothetical protein
MPVFANNPVLQRAKESFHVMVKVGLGGSACYRLYSCRIGMESRYGHDS